MITDSIVIRERDHPTSSLRLIHYSNPELFVKIFAISKVNRTSSQASGDPFV